MRVVGSGALLAVILAAALGAAGASAATGSGLEMNGYQIQTSQTNWNLNTGEFTMPNEVKVTRTGSDARGDHARGNSKNGTATLSGNVVIHDDGGAPEAREAGSDYNGPATITCDTLTLDSKQKSYDAEGNVKFSQGTRTGSADRGVLNQISHTLHLEGNVVLNDNGSSVKANVVDYNLATRDVVASGAPLVIKQPVPQQAPAPAPTPKPKPKKR